MSTENTVKQSRQSEFKRLKALIDYEILDTQAEQSYDDFTYVASKVFNTPVALVCFLDEKRLWFKSKVGVEADFFPREITICDKVIEQNDVFVVNDASKDMRFCNSPLITGDTAIRFYAGVPLKTPEGHNIGTFCVIDQKPKPEGITDEQKSILQAMARQIVSQLELQSNLRQVKVLKNLLPVCSYCKKAEIERNYWKQVESFISENGQVEFMSNICQECLETVFGQTESGMPNFQGVSSL